MTAQSQITGTRVLVAPDRIKGQPSGMSALIERKLFILNARADGYSRPSIAAALGIAPATVSRVASAPVDAPADWQPCVKDGVGYASQSDLARAFGVTRQAVSRHLNRYGHFERLGVRA